MFERIMDFIFRWEGGEVVTFDNDDPGGTTKWGISQRAHPGVDIINLTKQDALLIYKIEYWDKLPITEEYSTDLCLMDTAVNCGVSRAIAWWGKSKSWRGLLTLRCGHYISLDKPKYIKGWLNRVADLTKHALKEE